MACSTIETLTIRCIVETFQMKERKGTRVLQFQVPDHGGTSLAQESNDQHCHQLQPVQTTIEGKWVTIFQTRVNTKRLMIIKKENKVSYQFFYIK